MPLLGFRHKGGVRPQWPRGVRRLPELKTAQETTTGNFVILAGLIDTLYDHAKESESTLGKAKYHIAQIKFLDAFNKLEISAETDYQKIIDEIKTISDDERSLNLVYFMEQNDKLLVKMHEKIIYLEEATSSPENIDYMDSEYSSQFAENPFEFSVKQLDFLSKIIVDMTFTLLGLSHNVQYKGKNINENYLDILLKEFENLLTTLQISIKTLCDLYVWSPLKNENERFEILDTKFKKAGETINFATFIRQQIEKNVNDRRLGKAFESMTWI